MKIGTSWPLCWTEAQVDDTSMDVLVDAYQASLEMLRWVTGKPAPQPRVMPASPPSGTPGSTALIMAMFGKKS